MKSFEEQIPDIEKLDELRQRVRTLQQEAIEALTAKPYLPQPRKRSNSPKRKAYEALAARPDWEPPGDDVEKAEMLRALSLMTPRAEGSEERREKSCKALIADLKSITYEDCIDDEALDDVPVFRCALVLQALAETPGYVLSKTALVCLYRVVQELNEVAGPAWASGAARADADAQATAFITGECARALLAFETAMLQTASAAEFLGTEAAREARSPSEFKVWHEQEERFRARSLDISLAALPRVIICFSKPKGPAKRARKLLGEIVNALRAVPRMASLRLPKGAAPPPVASKDRMQTIVPTILAEVAKDIAWNAVRQLLKAIDNARIGSDPEASGKSLAEQFRRAAQVVRDALRPVEQFAESVIDRQIAAASPHLKVSVDGAELVFAATLLGLVSDWSRPKVRAAYEVLYPLLSVNGRLLSIRPFDIDKKGYRLNVATLEVTRRLADLVAKLDVEPEPEFVARLMLPFEYTRAPGAEKSERGWTNDPQPREPKSLWWLTAIALDALESIRRMLDETINRRVLQYFHVRRPENLVLGLDNLFYPDFGLSAFKGKDSIAVKLQQLRAHAGHGRAEQEPLRSLILYGPPGTGKTTLVEAIAKTAGVPLVEITPSDILVGGAEGVERRTRQVFQALSKLTHAVILFDEFDSILLDRAKRNPDEIPTSVIEFLTPGMLPKLKTLNDASREGRISYALATNFVDRLDAAVTRRGRFDEQVGVYPPDVASRLGRLLDQLTVFEQKITQELKKLSRRRAIHRLSQPERASRQTLRQLDKRLSDLEVTRKLIRESKIISPRVLTAVKETGGAAMDQIGRPGWYTAPEIDGHKNKLFDFLIEANKHVLGKVHREKNFEDEFEKEKIRIAELNEKLRRKQQIVTPQDSGTQVSPQKAAQDIDVARRPTRPVPTPPEKPQPAIQFHEYWTTWETVDKWDKMLVGAAASGRRDWNKLYRAVEKAARPKVGRKRRKSARS